MITKEKTIEILGRERDYEDKLVENLIDFCSISINTIPDITEGERAEVERNLTVILDESKKHSRMFEGLLKGVLENEKDKY